MPEVHAPQCHLQLGIARGDITPPVGIYHRMWGAATHDRATGVHRPLTATVACFRPLNGEVTREQILLAVDHCLLWGHEQSRLLAGLARRTALPVSALIVAYSHTHAAGLIDLSRRSLPGGELLEPYLDRLEIELARLVLEARSSVTPVHVVAGTARCDLAAQRDFFDEESGQFVCGFNPGAAADDTVVVARATTDAGDLRATFVNYACHPTTLAWKNTLISPDYPGAMREVIEGATGAPCLFLQGASADLGPREGFVGDPAVADRNGRQLGYAALATLTALPAGGTCFRYAGPVVSGATLGSWETRSLSSQQLGQSERFDIADLEVSLAYRPELPTREQVEIERGEWLDKKQAALAAGDATGARDCHAMVERMDRQLTRLSVLPSGPRFPFPVRLWRLGTIVWVALEGELYQVFQQELRSRFPDVAVFVTTLANGSRCSYIPPAETYGRGIYQESIALLARGSAEQLLEEVAQGIGQLLSVPAGATR